MYSDAVTAWVILLLFPHCMAQYCPSNYKKMKVYWTEYIKTYIREENGEVVGGFLKALRQSLNHCCKDMDFTLEKLDQSGRKMNERTLAVLAQIDNNNETISLVFPMLAAKDAESVMGLLHFVPLKTSPGPMVLTSKGVLDLFTTDTIEFLRLWINPVLFLMISSAAAAGVLLWLLEFHSKERFSSPLATLISEVGHSFWFSIVTMTTVGYGDIVPKFPLARCYTMIWMLAGMIFTSLYTAHVSSTLTTLQIIENKSLIGKKVGVIRGTKRFFENEINFGASITEYDESNLFQALYQGNVTRILMPDFLEAMYFLSIGKRNKANNVVVIDTIKHPFSIGLAVLNNVEPDKSFMRCWKPTLKWIFTDEQQMDYSAIDKDVVSGNSLEIMTDHVLVTVSVYTLAGAITVFALGVVKMFVEQKIKRKTSVEMNETHCPKRNGSELT